MKEEIDQNLENDSSSPVFNYQAGVPAQTQNAHAAKVDVKQNGANGIEKSVSHAKTDKNGVQKNGVSPVKQSQPQPVQTKTVQPQTQVKPVAMEVKEERKDLKQTGPKKIIQIKAPEPDLKPTKPKSPPTVVPSIVATTAPVEAIKQTVNVNVVKKSEAPKAWNKVASAGPVVPTPIAASPPKPVVAPPQPNPVKVNQPKKTQPTPIRKEESDGFVEVNRKGEKKPVVIDDKDKNTVMLRNLPDSTTRAMLTTAYEVYGPIQHIDMSSSKLAFITFRAIETATSVLGRCVVVGVGEVIAEEKGKFQGRGRGAGAGFKGRGNGTRGRGRVEKV